MMTCFVSAHRAMVKLRCKTVTEISRNKNVLICCKNSFAYASSFVQSKRKHKPKNKKQQQSSSNIVDPYYVFGSSKTKPLRLSISISPNIQQIWKHIQKARRLDDSVFMCAIQRCIQLKLNSDISDLMHFMIDADNRSFLMKNTSSSSASTTNNNGGIEYNSKKKMNIKYFEILFEGFYELNDMHLALDWFNFMIIENENEKNSNEVISTADDHQNTHDSNANINSNEVNIIPMPNTNVFNSLIGLCFKNDAMEQGLRFYEWMGKLDIPCNAQTYAEMLRLLSVINMIDDMDDIDGDHNTNNKSESETDVDLGIDIERIFNICKATAAEDGEQQPVEQKPLLSISHFNYLFEGIAQNQRRTATASNTSSYFDCFAFENLLCSEFDEELRVKLPAMIDNYFEDISNFNIHNKNHQLLSIESPNIDVVDSSRSIIEPNLQTFEHMLLIGSYYGCSSFCLKYFQLLMLSTGHGSGSGSGSGSDNGLQSMLKIRPSIHIFNCMISAYCNEIAFQIQHQPQQQQQPPQSVQAVDEYQVYLDKIFQIYHHCKDVLVAPNLTTMKLISHAIRAMILLWDEENDAPSKLLDIRSLMQPIFENDCKNYGLLSIMDKELLFYIAQCYILLQEQMTQTQLNINSDIVGFDFDADMNTMNTRTLFEKIAGFANINNDSNAVVVDLSEIPIRAYEDCYQQYLSHAVGDSAMQTETTLEIVVPFTVDTRETLVIQDELREITMNPRVTYNATRSSAILGVFSSTP